MPSPKLSRRCAHCLAGFWCSTGEAITFDAQMASSLPGDDAALRPEVGCGESRARLPIRAFFSTACIMNIKVSRIGLTAVRVEALAKAVPASAQVPRLITIGRGGARVL